MSACCVCERVVGVDGDECWCVRELIRVFSAVVVGDDVGGEGGVFGE